MNAKLASVVLAIGMLALVTSAQDEKLYAGFNVEGHVRSKDPFARLTRKRLEGRRDVPDRMDPGAFEPAASAGRTPFNVRLRQFFAGERNVRAKLTFVNGQRAWAIPGGEVVIVPGKGRLPTGSVRIQTGPYKTATLNLNSGAISHRVSVLSGKESNTNPAREGKGGITLRDRRTGLTYKWRGGHTVNVFDSAGDAIDVFSVGDFAEDSASVEEVRAGIQRHSQDVRKGARGFGVSEPNPATLSPGSTRPYYRETESVTVKTNAPNDFTVDIMPRKGSPVLFHNAKGLTIFAFKEMKDLGEGVTRYEFGKGVQGEVVRDKDGNLYVQFARRRAFDLPPTKRTSKPNPDPGTPAFDEALEKESPSTVIETDTRTGAELAEVALGEAESYGVDVSDLRREYDAAPAEGPQEEFADETFQSVQERLNAAGFYSDVNEQGAWVVYDREATKRLFAEDPTLKPGKKQRKESPLGRFQTSEPNPPPPGRLQRTGGEGFRGVPPSGAFAAAQKVTKPNPRKEPHPLEDSPDYQAAERLYNAEAAVEGSGKRFWELDLAEQNRVIQERRELGNRAGKGDKSAIKRLADVSRYHMSDELSNERVSRPNPPPSEAAREFIGEKIAAGFHERERAEKKAKRGIKLSQRERERLRRTDKQIQAIAFSQARKRGYNVSAPNPPRRERRRKDVDTEEILRFLFRGTRAAVRGGARGAEATRERLSAAGRTRAQRERLQRNLTALQLARERRAATAEAREAGRQARRERQDIRRETRAARQARLEELARHAGERVGRAKSFARVHLRRKA